ncbi:MAG: DUF5682 family protein [Deinococcota bacterium]
MTVHLFGIRHHGPGSARSLLRALERLEPDLLLIEGPPDADKVINLASHEDMQPPVAILVYAPDKPQEAAFYPFAEYSPEWQAMRYALNGELPVRFMDLAQTYRMSLTTSSKNADDTGDERRGDDDSVNIEDDAESKSDDGIMDDETENDDIETDLSIRHDPLGQLAAAAGYSDGERWWDQMVESRREGEGLFTAIQEAMVTLRETSPAYEDKLEHLREAAMREVIRKAEKEGYERIAVVCGAWHVPALLDRKNVKADKALLKGLAKTKVTATWTPWTYGRLTQRSGYGAGVASPGWYHHLWQASDHLSARWLTQVATLLREQDLPASSAHVIEGVRLADSLAALRGKAMAGLEELNDAVQTVFAFGSGTPLKLIEDKLMVGERLGQISPDAPMLPLQQDLMRHQKSLRMKPKATESILELDLRKDMHLGRSHLLHRLRLLGIPWGDTQQVYGKKGSFHEHWQIHWQPEFAIRLIEMAVWGNTVVLASSQFVKHEAAHAPTLPALTKLLDDTLLADLPDAVATLTSELENKAAIISDVSHLMAALPPLVNVLRYGNVRKTDASQVAHVLTGLVPRMCIGLPAACSSLDDAAASKMFQRIIQIHSSLQVLADDAYSSAWSEALQNLIKRDTIHGLVTGRATRLLFDTGVLSGEASARHLGLALSRASEPTDAAAWIEGFLKDSGIILLHDANLWTVLDNWLQELNEESFVQLVPLLRRTFSTFSVPERRQMGERVKHRIPQASGLDEELDEGRAQAVMPVIRQLLGLTELTP